MGHMLPHAFTAWGGLFFSLEQAVERIIHLLYKDVPNPTAPKSDKTPKKTERNLYIKKLHAEGVSVPELAKMFNISEQRVHQILRGKNR